MRLSTVLLCALLAVIQYNSSSASPSVDQCQHPALWNLRSGSSNKKVATPAHNLNQSAPKVELFGPLQTFAKTIKDAQRHLIAAAVARGVSILSMYPVGKVYHVSFPCLS